MLSRALTSSARRAAFTPTSSRVALFSSSARRFGGQPDHNSNSQGSPVTSTSHPTVPHAAPKPTAFFARKNIGLEVTPLMAFIATIGAVGISFLVKNALFDEGVQHRHGVEKDDALKKAISQPDPKPKEEKKEEKGDKKE
ncbi:hypothetical protein JCM6882_001876 [Rhodosporidiobolus microsporus]